MARRVNVGHGEIMLELEFAPQALFYRVSLIVWKGLERSEEDSVVEAPLYRLTNTFLKYDLKASAEMAAWRQMAEETACRAVQACTTKGLAELNDEEMAQTKYIITCGIMKAVETGNSDNTDDAVEQIDLREDMLAIRREKARQAQEAARLAMEAWEAHLTDVQRHSRMSAEEKQKAYDASVGLLWRYLDEEEREEAKSKGYVTVKTLSGDFLVPVKAHGLVEQYVDGKYKASYCIVFEDYSIPCGDEALMKVILLKADIARFMKFANKFVNHPCMRRRRDI